MADDRFGLAYSLEEALRADASPLAVSLANLLADQPAPRSPRRTGPGWRAALAGLGLAAMVGTAHAASLGGDSSVGPSLEGRWVMAPTASRFREDVTGPAPDSAVMIVGHDRDDRFSYRLIERRDGAEVARAGYDVSFAGARSTVSVGGRRQAVTAAREPAGDIVIRTDPAPGYHGLIRFRRTGPDTATLEHVVEAGGAPVSLERISFVRATDAGERVAAIEPASVETVR